MKIFFINFILFNFIKKISLKKYFKIYINNLVFLEIFYYLLSKLFKKTNNNVIFLLKLI